jgi:NTP pyrophosphatase (non-canonical NTP hydrolase)
MTDYSKLGPLHDRILKFVDERDWRQFHNPKDVAISLNLEAAELLEHFQWKSPEEIKRHLAENRAEVADELVDVLYWVMLMGEYFDVDLSEALDRKMSKNEAKYPADKARGKNAKYTEYEQS